MSGQELAGLLERHGFDLFTGVPCSLVEDVIAALEARREQPWIAAVREDVAVGLAGGAFLGGRRPVVVMQNSGLGTSLNALASLTLMYRLPALLLVTWRGYLGQDAPEHLLTGQITPALLELLGIPVRVLARESLAADVAWADHELAARQSPVALLVPPRALTGGTPHHTEAATPSTAACNAAGGEGSGAVLHPRISRLAALASAVKCLGTEPVIHANGYICRESFSIADRPQNFYMIGSMGLASAIALGVALAVPDRPSVVFDGDGNLLMNLGILPMVGGLRPRRFIHVTFDNEVYGSTGNQRSPSRDVRLDAVARAAGYRTSVAVTEPDEIGEALRRALGSDGPHFILAKVTAEEANVPRIPHTPEQIRDRFRASFERSHGHLGQATLASSRPPRSDP